VFLFGILVFAWHSALRSRPTSAAAASVWDRRSWHAPRRWSTDPSVWLVAFLAVFVAPVSGQTAVPGFTTTKQYTLERLGDDHWRATGQVELEKDDMKFFADQVDYYPQTHRLVATGSVVYASRENRIAADRLEFDTESRLGTFYNASGTARLTQEVDRSMFGTQEPEAYFYGEVIEKIGPNKYRIRKGGFTTCLQPTPRWEVSAGSLTLTLDDYAIVRHSVLKVKGVPLFYMPIFYYPVQEDDRATGFLIPAYGTSTIRGQSLSNAFFWAIDRSQDATILHDWFSQTGQGVGGEYRYVAGPGSEGSARTYLLREREVTYTDAGGNDRVQPGRQSYELRARMIHALPGHLRARADIDYFSDVTVQQLYQTNLYEASQRQRSYGGNVSGSWGADSVSATYAVRELFANDDESTLLGNAPRIAYTRAPRRLGGAPVYFSFGSEVNTQLRTDRVNDVEDVGGVTRIDLSPQVRVPLSQWPFLAMQGSVAWRHTFYSHSLDDADQRVEEWLPRRYLDMRAEITGPTLTRIFDTQNGFADRIKHVIEPTLSVQRTTLIDNYDRIIKLDSYDYTFGGTTRMTYGITTRLLARRQDAAAQSSAREFLTVSAAQTYYSDTRASQVDPSYSSSFQRLAPHKLSPWLVTARVAPADNVDGGLRLEFDRYEKEILSIGASGRFAYRDVLQTTSGWSRRKLTQTRFDNYWNVGTSLRSAGGRVGGFFGFDYDFARDQLLQRRVQAFYNAQCCGVAVEYQTYNFPTSDSRFLVPRDRRFNVTFTLAGIGTFSNIFGAFGNPDPVRSR
jgi:LPS-assembly protein